MACLSSELKAIYQERHDKYATLLVSALEYFENGLSSEGLESFKFDSGEAMSWARYSDPGDFLQKVINPIEAKIDHYRNKLNGTGIVKLNLRRKGGYGC